jgi:type IV secretory pathway VirB10-like protein
VVLVSAVDSDAPGEVVAMVTHDVYDRGMRVVLIPRATRLLGHPVGGAVLGQRRLSLVWERLLLPDGRTVVLPGVPSQDATGAAGVAARVDNHTGSVLRSALLLSAVGAGAQLSQPQQSATYGQALSVGQTMAAAAGQELTQVSGEMIRRGLDVRPTLSLPQGTRLQVLLTGDLALEPFP